MNLRAMTARHGIRRPATAFLIAFACAMFAVRMIAFAWVLTLREQGTWQDPGPWVDWRTYANAFDRLVHGGAIYAPAQLTEPYQLTHVVLIGYAYPPLSVPLFAPFASYPLGLAGWLTLNLGLFFTALWALLSRLSPRYRGALFAITMIGLTFYEPLVIGAVSANLNVGLSGLIGWIAVGVSPTAAGVFGAAGAITKISSSVLLFGAEHGKKRSIIVTLGAVLILSVLTLPITGARSWIDFARAMALNVPDCYPGNLSVACALSPNIGLPTATAIGILIGLAAAGLSLAVRDRFWLALLAAVAIAAPVTNLHVHYWIAAPLLAVAAVERLKARRTDAAKLKYQGRGGPDSRGRRSAVTG